MANNFESNFTRKLARVFLDAFETERVLSKNVNTQLLDGKFDPSTGDKTDFKRPTDYKSVRTPEGDVSAIAESPIITGKATGYVQDYFTVFVKFNEADEALKMDQLDQLLRPMAKRIVTDFELDFAFFMRNNAGLLAGDHDTPVTTWDDIAYAGAMLQAHGVPMDDPWCYSVNPFTQRKLASNQRSLGSGGSSGTLISEAHKKAVITENFAGFDKVMTATTLAPYITSPGALRAGTLAADPDVTYLTHKDSMIQELSVTGFEPNLQINDGEVIEIDGRNRLNLSTRKEVLDEEVDVVVFTGTVVETVVLDGTGAGIVKITGPAIWEADGAYNTVGSAPVTGDVVTLLGAANSAFQPNLFWHKNAFSVGSVPIKKLYSTDTIATSEDGLQIRVSKGSGFFENRQDVRFDFRPAYAVLNPFFAGQGFGLTP